MIAGLAMQVQRLMASSIRCGAAIDPGSWPLPTSVFFFLFGRDSPIKETTEYRIPCKPASLQDSQERQDRQTLDPDHAEAII